MIKQIVNHSCLQLIFNMKQYPDTRNAVHKLKVWFKPDRCGPKAARDVKRQEIGKVPLNRDQTILVTNMKKWENLHSTAIKGYLILGQLRALKLLLSDFSLVCHCGHPWVSQECEGNERNSVTCTNDLSCFKLHSIIEHLKLNLAFEEVFTR